MSLTKKNKRFIYPFLFPILIVFSQSFQSYSQGANRKIRQAERKEAMGAYKETKILYQEVLHNDSTNYRANIGLGKLFLYKYELYDSAQYYLGAGLKNKNVDTNYNHVIDYANCLRLQEKPEEAIQLLKQYKTPYLNEISKRERAEKEATINQEIKYCKNSISGMKNLNSIILIENMSYMINSRESEYTPIYISESNTLIYNARYQDQRKEKMDLDGKFRENLYYFDLTETVVTTVDESIEQKFHHGIASKMGDSDSILVYYKNVLWVSYLEHKKLSNYSPLPSGESDFYFQPHGTYTKNLDTLIFSGKPTIETPDLDLYIITLSNSVWSKPEKLPFTINTDLDEDSPLFSDNGKTLYFSSKGHNSAGGYDIFKTTLDENGEWTSPVNLGYPINSAGHDTYYVLNKDNKTGYFSSNRNGGFGLMDIYSFDLEKKPEFDCPTFENTILTVNFDLSESIDSSSVDLKYEWRFDEETKMQYGVKTTKTFDAPGKHFIYINIIEKESGHIEVSEIIKEIFIDSVDYIGFRVDGKKQVGENLMFDAGVSYLENHTFIQYHWKIADSIITNEAPILNYSFLDTGWVEISLEIEALENETDFKSFCMSKEIFIGEKITDESLFANNGDSENSDNTNNSSNSDNTDNSNSNNNDSENSDYVSNDSLNILIKGQLDNYIVQPIYFSFDKYGLNRIAISHLDSLITILNSNPSFKLIISGHTDSKGSQSYNISLSKKRIVSTLAYLTKNNISADRIIKTLGKGESEPAAPNELNNGMDSKKGRLLNRRVEFIIVQ